jgi:putative hydrolase
MKLFDFHIHSEFSADSRSPLEQIVEEAETKGLDAIAITDHGPELSVGIDPRQIRAYFEKIQRLRESAPLKVLIGMEINIVDDRGNVDLDPAWLARLELPVFSVHYTPSASSTEEKARLYVQMVRLCLERIRSRVSVLAHPFFVYRPLLRHIPREDVEEILELMADRGVAAEINVRYRTPPDELLGLCLHKGVKMSIGSDAHSLSEVGDVRWAMRRLARLGAKEEDLLLSEVL